MIECGTWVPLDSFMGLIFFLSNIIVYPFLLRELKSFRLLSVEAVAVVVHNQRMLIAATRSCMPPFPFLPESSSHPTHRSSHPKCIHDESSHGPVILHGTSSHSKARISCTSPQDVFRLLSGRIRLSLSSSFLFSSYLFQKLDLFAIYTNKLIPSIALNNTRPIPIRISVILYRLRFPD